MKLLGCIHKLQWNKFKLEAFQTVMNLKQEQNSNKIKVMVFCYYDAKLKDEGYRISQNKEVAKAILRKHRMW